jgi:hypothetical protein
MQDALTWKLNDNQRSQFDGRALILANLAPNWVRANVPPMQRTGSLKAHDLYLYVTTAMEYITHGFIPPGNPTRGFFGMLKALRALLQENSDHQEDPQAQADAAKKIENLNLLVVEGLCDFEKGCPKISLCMLAHLIVHIPSCIHRWNSVRNFWAFLTERYMLLLHVYIMFYTYTIFSTRIHLCSTRVDLHPTRVYTNPHV